MNSRRVYDILNSLICVNLIHKVRRNDEILFQFGNGVILEEPVNVHDLLYMIEME